MTLRRDPEENIQTKKERQNTKRKRGKERRQIRKERDATSTDYSPLGRQRNT
jgi:hypothetical protein